MVSGTGGHFVCACVNSATEAFSVNCLRSVPAFAGCFLELNDVYWVLRSTNMFFKVSRYFYDESEFIVASLSPLRGQFFHFVKQYIGDRMAAECSYDLTFRAHFLSSRKRSVWYFFVKQLSYRYLILLHSITLKSKLIVSGRQWLIKCPFFRETAF